MKVPRAFRDRCASLWCRPCRTRTSGCDHAELRAVAEETHIMVMAHVVERWTRALVLALPDDGNRYELFDGQLLVTPAPSLRHQRAVGALHVELAAFVTSQRVGEVLASPADLSLGGDQLSQPDLFVIPGTPTSLSWEDLPLPILVVEVLSPSTARYDRLVKRRRFQQAGIPEYWVVDLDAGVVERWRPEDERPEILSDTLVWRPAAAEVELRLDLATYFARLAE